MLIGNFYKDLIMTISIQDLKHSEFTHREYLKDSKPKSSDQAFRDTTSKLHKQEQKQNTFFNKFLEIEEDDGLLEHVALRLIKSTIDQFTGNDETYDNLGAKLSGGFDRSHASRLKDIHSKGEKISDAMALEFCNRRESMEADSRKSEPVTAKLYHSLTDYFNPNDSTSICEKLLKKKGAEELFYSVFITKPGLYLSGNAQYYRNEIKKMLSEKGVSKHLEDITSSSVDCLIGKAELVQETSLDADLIFANYDSCGI